MATAGRADSIVIGLKRENDKNNIVEVPLGRWGKRVALWTTMLRLRGVVVATLRRVRVDRASFPNIIILSGSRWCTTVKDSI